MDQSLLVMTNVPDASVATVLARHLVANKLAACVNLLPGVQSIYRWQGAIEAANEITMIIKTTQARYLELETAIQTLHPYQVPEIIALPISGGFPPYLDWIAQETKKDVNV
jgi:periplasmic divalent cation tolerance protein